MRDARLTRRNFLAGAVGASAAFALPGVAAPAVKKGTSLRLWILKTYVEPTNKAIEAAAQRWAQKHGAAVTVEYFTFEDVQTKYVAAIENKNTPDIGQLETGAPARFAGMGQLLDLTSFARQVEGEVGRPPANVAPVTVIGGTTYAIPWYIMPAFWYVWRDVFEKNNVKLPSTFDEAKAAAAALNRPKDNFYGMGQSWNRTADGYGVMQSLMYSHGVGWAAKDGKYQSIRTPKMQQVMKWATDIYKEGLQPADTLTWTGSGNNENFIAKNIAQTSNGPSITFAMENAVAKGDRREGPQGARGGAGQSPGTAASGRARRPPDVGHRDELRHLQDREGPRSGHEPGRASPVPRGDRAGDERLLRSVHAGARQGARGVEGLFQQERELPHVRPRRRMVLGDRLAGTGHRRRRRGAGEQRAHRRAGQGDRGQVVERAGGGLGRQEDQGNLRHHRSLAPRGGGGTPVPPRSSCCRSSCW